jgi:hypothetical protein
LLRSRANFTVELWGEGDAQASWDLLLGSKHNRALIHSDSLCIKMNQEIKARPRAGYEETPARRTFLGFRSGRPMHCEVGNARLAPISPNSIFKDGSPPFPQMDVWSRWLRADHRAGHVGPTFNGSQTTNRGATRQLQTSASENSPVKCREKCFFP